MPKTMIAIATLTAVGMVVAALNGGPTSSSFLGIAALGPFVMVIPLVAGIGDPRAYCFDGPLVWVRWRWGDWKRPPADLRRVVGIDFVALRTTATMYLFEPNTTDEKGQRTAGRGFTKQQRDALQIHAPLRVTEVQLYNSPARSNVNSPVALHLMAGLASNSYVMTNRAIKILKFYGLTADADGRLSPSPPPIS